MSWNNKVLWTEGMFLRPQHFQQQTRYFENFVERRCGEAGPFNWGFNEIKLDANLLGLGKVGLLEARGVFPDGTPFNVRDGDPTPAPLDIPEDVRDEEVFLGLPTRRPNSVEADASPETEGMARYWPQEYEARDTGMVGGNVADIQVGGLRMRLLLARDRRDDYTCMGLGRIREARSDKLVVMDDHYIPPVMNYQTAPPLASFLKELQGVAHQRADALAARASASGRGGGAAEIGDFLLLQVLNRYEPLLIHLMELSDFHPERLFRLFVEMAGELSTFMSAGKRPKEFDPYKHDDLQGAFTPVMDELRQEFSMEMYEAAVAIPLEERKYGVRVAMIADRSLIRNASFVLAVHANVTTDELRNNFPKQIKIAPVETLERLVNKQLPGILLHPLAVAPRQIPFYTKYAYFELDRNSEYWNDLETSGAMALYLAGQYPGIKMELWAIKG